MEIRKKDTFPQVINNPIIYKFFKDFTNFTLFNKSDDMYSLKY